jgi:hypothetical protein
MAIYPLWGWIWMNMGVYDIPFPDFKKWDMPF